MRTITVEKIIKNARLKTDTEDSGFVSDEELLLALNNIRRSLYAQIITKTQSPQFLSETILTNPVNGVFELPEDFFQLKLVQGDRGGSFIHLEPKSLTELNEPTGTVYQTANASYVLLGSSVHVYPKEAVVRLRIVYNAIPVDLELDGGEEEEEYNNEIKLIYHEDRYLIAALSEYIMQKEESDFVPFTNERFEVLQEIIQTYKPSNEFPKKVVNKRNRYRNFRIM